MFGGNKGGIPSRLISSRRICKWIDRLEVSVLVLVLTVSAIGIGVKVEASEKERNVYNGNIPVDAKHKISILIGEGDSKAFHRDESFGIFAEDGDGGNSGGESRPNGTNAVSTTWDKCNEGSRSRCCYQYTWPGYLDTIPEPANATCEYLWKDRRNEEFACFEPLVFTQSTDQGDHLGSPPNFSVLTAESRKNNYNIYCPMADKNCITYTYYSRDGNKLMTNQTKFCGIVTDSTSGNRLQDGCYKQNVHGYVREVCVCTKNLCNGHATIMQSSSAISLILGVMLIFLAKQFFNKTS